MDGCPFLHLHRDVLLERSGCVKQFAGAQTIRRGVALLRPTATQPANGGVAQSGCGNNTETLLQHKKKKDLPRRYCFDRSNTTAPLSSAGSTALTTATGAAVQTDTYHRGIEKSRTFHGACYPPAQQPVQSDANLKTCFRPRTLAGPTCNRNLTRARHPSCLPEPVSAATCDAILAWPDL